MFVGALSLQASKACPKTLACVFACRWTSLPDQRTRQRPSRRRQRCACGCCGTRRLCCGGLVCARPRYGRHWGPSRHLPLVNAQQCDAVCTAHTAQQCGMHCPSYPYRTAMRCGMHCPSYSYRTAMRYALPISNAAQQCGMHCPSYPSLFSPY